MFTRSVLGVFGRPWSSLAFMYSICVKTRGGQQCIFDIFWLFVWRGSIQTWRLRGIRKGLNPTTPDKSSTAHITGQAVPRYVLWVRYKFRIRLSLLIIRIKTGFCSLGLAVGWPGWRWGRPRTNQRIPCSRKRGNYHGLESEGQPRMFQYSIYLIRSWACKPIKQWKYGA